MINTNISIILLPLGLVRHMVFSLFRKRGKCTLQEINFYQLSKDPYLPDKLLALQDLRINPCSLESESYGSSMHHLLITSNSVPEDPVVIGHTSLVQSKVEICPRARTIYQSSSSSLPLCIALCLALKASANPPAKLGVLRPLSPPLLVILVPESRGAGGGIGLRPPAAGRFDGGAGGCGLARMTGAVPFFDGGGGGVGRKAGAGGGGGASSLRYAEGAQPFLPEEFLANHQPRIALSIT